MALLLQDLEKDVDMTNVLNSMISLSRALYL